MNTKNTNPSGSKDRGSAMILVVVVTVLLAMVGIMFLMVSRVGDMMGTAAQQEHEMDQAVGTVTTRIERILMQDLFGNNLDRGIIDGQGGVNEPYDAPGQRDPWLASLEPEPVLPDPGDPADPTDDLYKWPYISNIITNTVNFGGGAWDRILRDGGSTWTFPQHGGIIPDYQDAGAVLPTRPADADGDGVADSVWIPMGQASDGEYIYTAVRIIDNCAMLNLNTAHMTRIQSSVVLGDGKYLSQVDYERFLRGNDRAVPDVVRRARMFNPTPLTPIDGFDAYHNNVIMNIENPGPAYTLFDISDELEIRNRFLLTSKAQARFEREMQIAGAPYQYGLYETFDYDRGEFSGGWDVELRVKRIPVDSSNDLRIWKQRMNPENFDDTSPWESSHNYGYYYDRRHVCTFYSFDRNLRGGGDPYLASMTVAEREIYKKIFMPGDGHAVSVRVPIIPEDNPNPDIAAQNRYEARLQVLRLLYAFRAYYRGQGDPLLTASRKAAQVVANMIDYLDDSTAGAQTGPFASSLYGTQYNERPTYINRQIINRLIAEVSAYLHNSVDPAIPFYPEVAIPAVFDFGLASGDVIYGFERQPFISELYVQRNDSNNTVEVALELLNPYDTAISLANWRILFNRVSSSTPFTIPTGNTIPAASSSAPSRLVIRSSSLSVPVTGTAVTLAGFGMGTLLADANSIDLQRPDPRDSNYSTNPTQFITVERIPYGQIRLMLTDTPADGRPTYHAIKRQDTGWKFTNAAAFVHQQAVALANSPARLGTANVGITVPQSGWQMPVDVATLFASERRFFTLGDFQKVLFVGNQGGNDPNTITSSVAAAANEGDIRFDILQNPELLGFVCFLNRDKGSLPGRININTAPQHVLAAAIPVTAPLPYAQAIVNGRTTAGYANLGALLGLPQWNTPGSPTGDDTSITGDLQERDWLLANMSNIFTARSDVFTAYILVRLGPNGPQRRVMAIFDRSQVWSPEDRPRIVAIKTVPNPR